MHRNGGRTVRALVLQACVVSLVALAPRAAMAFCLATTCDRVNDDCAVDAHGCNLEGMPLHWDGGKVQLLTGAEGSPLRDITGDELAAATDAAVRAWTSASCANGDHPALTVKPALQSSGLEVTFARTGANENVVLFFDGSGPFDARAVGKTTLGFALSSGVLDDADIALNSKGYAYTLTGDDGTTDLQAVLTHEIGHVLGLDHSDADFATMQAETSGFATVELRSLEQDDVDAICSAYPPATTREKDTPGDAGGCSVARVPGKAPSSVAGLGALAGVALLRRRGQHAGRQRRSGAPK